ncbi:hypothetical protein ACFSYD_24965 [Paracoccus aerius]
MELAGAALAVGRLEARLTAMDDKARAGATRRLALVEIEEMLRAQGTPCRERRSDWTPWRPARAPTCRPWPRPAGPCGGWKASPIPLGCVTSWPCTGPRTGQSLPGRIAPRARPLTRRRRISWTRSRAVAPASPGPRARGRMLWRLAELSPDDAAIEGAVWAARDMARATPGLAFLPLGRHGRAIWADGGPPEARLSRHLAALARGAEDACRMLDRLADWAQSAREATAAIKGQNPARIIEALAAHPVLHTAQVEELAGISRDTAERLLSRMRKMGLVREITGARRFRLWVAAA